MKRHPLGLLVGAVVAQTFALALGKSEDVSYEVKRREMERERDEPDPGSPMKLDKREHTHPTRISKRQLRRQKHHQKLTPRKP